MKAATACHLHGKDRLCSGCDASNSKTKTDQISCGRHPISNFNLPCSTGEVKVNLKLEGKGLKAKEVLVLYMPPLYIWTRCAGTGIMVSLIAWPGDIATLLVARVPGSYLQNGRVRTLTIAWLQHCYSTSVPFLVFIDRGRSEVRLKPLPQVKPSFPLECTGNFCIQFNCQCPV